MADPILKAYIQENFWKLVDNRVYPNLKACALKLHSYCVSTYLCESLFSNMNYIKFKFRTRLTDSHLDNCLRINTSSCEPEYEELVKNIQFQVSH